MSATTLLTVYAIGAVLICCFFARRNFGHLTAPPLTGSVLGWIGLTVVIGSLLWSTIGCLYFHGFSSAWLLLFCALGGNYFTIAIAALFLPIYVPLMTAYIRFALSREGHLGFLGVPIGAAALATPIGAILFLMSPAPHAGDPFDPLDPRGGTALAMTGWFSASVALVVARLPFGRIRAAAQRRNGPG